MEHGNRRLRHFQQLFYYIGCVGLEANEDIALGQALSLLVKPLLREHVVYRNMMLEVEHRRNLRQFEKELVEKTKFDSLIPFLLESLSNLICANDVSIFLVEDNNFITFDVEDQRLVQKTIDKKGTLLWVVQNQHNIVTEKLDEETPNFDVIIDFSVAKAADGLISYCEETKIPLVLCTTGLSEDQLLRVNKLSETSAVLRSANMSVGINLLIKVLKEISPVLAAAGFDIEILEKHHNRKLEEAGRAQRNGSCPGGRHQRKPS